MCWKIYINSYILFDIHLNKWVCHRNAGLFGGIAESGRKRTLSRFTRETCEKKWGRKGKVWPKCDAQLIENEALHLRSTPSLRAAVCGTVWRLYIADGTGF